MIVLFLRPVQFVEASSRFIFETRSFRPVPSVRVVRCRVLYYKHGSLADTMYRSFVALDAHMISAERLLVEFP
jgi:hypothetical protein